MPRCSKVARPESSFQRTLERTITSLRLNAHRLDTTRLEVIQKVITLLATRTDRVTSATNRAGTR